MSHHHLWFLLCPTSLPLSLSLSPKRGVCKIRRISRFALGDIRRLFPLPCPSNEGPSISFKCCEKLYQSTRFFEYSTKTTLVYHYQHHRYSNPHTSIQDPNQNNTDDNANLSHRQVSFFSSRVSEIASDPLHRFQLPTENKHLSYLIPSYRHTHIQPTVSPLTQF